MKYLDSTAVVSFFVVSLAGIVQHSFLLQLNSDWSERLFQAYALGVGYDVMNGAIFSTSPYFISLQLFGLDVVLFPKHQNIMEGISFTTFKTHFLDA